MKAGNYAPFNEETKSKKFTYYFIAVIGALVFSVLLIAGFNLGLWVWGFVKGYWYVALFILLLLILLKRRRNKKKNERSN